MYFRVFVLMLLGYSGTFCQEEVIPLGLEPTTTELPPPPIVCSLCSCIENVMGCTNRGLKASFSQEEWQGLQSANVTELDISSNFLEYFPYIQTELSIEVLNISNNRIEKAEDRCFMLLPNLTKLDLSNNRIITLSKGVFQGLILVDQHKVRTFVKMRHLSLADNEIHTLPKDVFSHMQDLTFLDLSGNPLGIIDQVVMGALSDLPLLQELKLSGCELETLPAGLLRRQRRLQRLDISRNQFKTVPEVLAEAVNLVYLNLDRNLLRNLSAKTSISKLTKLKELRLCRNTKLQSIGPGALAGLENLVILWVCNNPRLSEIDDEFLKWTDEHFVEQRPLLKELYLHNNNLTTIPSGFLSRWDQLRKMDFSNNPYACDCGSQWMADVLVPFIISTGGSAADMICNKPQEFRGLSFAQLHLTGKTLRCVEPQGLTETPGPNMAIILGVMIGVFATIPAVLVIVLLWKRGYFAKCRRKLNSDESESEENDAF